MPPTMTEGAPEYFIVDALNRIDKRLDGVESKLDSKTDRLEDRLDRVEAKLEVHQAGMEHREGVEERLLTKVERIGENLTSIDHTLVKQQSILDEHVRRTNLLEAKISQDTDAIRKDLPEETRKTIKAEVDAFKAKSWEVTKVVLKVLAVIGAGSGGGIALKQLLPSILNAIVGGGGH